MVDVHGSILRTVPSDADVKGPVYSGRLQVIGPGFAPFKPYLRPRYFYLRVSSRTGVMKAHQMMSEH